MVAKERRYGKGKRKHGSAATEIDDKCARNIEKEKKHTRSSTQKMYLHGFFKKDGDSTEDDALNRIAFYQILALID